MCVRAPCPRTKREEKEKRQKGRERKRKKGTEIEEEDWDSPPQALLIFEEVLEKVMLGMGLCQPQVALGVPLQHASGGALGALAQTTRGAWVCFGQPPTHQIA